MSNIEFSIMLPAFIAGLLILATHVPLGMKVLARGVIFVDLAVAQIAGLGVIVAGLLGLEGNTFAVQGMAATSALLGAALLAYTERKRPQVQEATIGLVFVLAASLGVLLLSRDAHAGDLRQDLQYVEAGWFFQRVIGRAVHFEAAFAQRRVTGGFVVAEAVDKDPVQSSRHHARRFFPFDVLGR